MDGYGAIFRRCLHLNYVKCLNVFVILLIGGVALQYSFSIYSYGVVLLSKVSLNRMGRFGVTLAEQKGHLYSVRGSTANASRDTGAATNGTLPGVLTTPVPSSNPPVAPTTTATGLEACPLVPPNLVGPMKIVTDPPSLDDQEKLFTHLEPGGRYKPKECVSRHRVAIIVPYRDREAHLLAFINHMHRMLKRQQLDYGIFVIEQAGDGKFNRGKLLNVGFLEASASYNFQCFVFHDVDMIPEDDRNLYVCSDNPRHMTVAINRFEYRLPYQNYFGGACALTRQQMELVNGFSNEFWGWGAEDDDFYNRVVNQRLNVTRYPVNIARYTMLTHEKAIPSPIRVKLLQEGKFRYKTDGINSLRYKRINIVLKKLYTWILVDLESKVQPIGNAHH